VRASAGKSSRSKICAGFSVGWVKKSNTCFGTDQSNIGQQARLFLPRRTIESRDFEQRRRIAMILPLQFPMLDQRKAQIL